MQLFNLIILAAGVKGPLYPQTGIINKAMIPIHEKPLLDWVIDSFHGCARIGKIVVIGPEELAQLAGMRYVDKRLNPGMNLMQNLLTAVNYLKNSDAKAAAGSACLISFCDAVFLNSHVIDTCLDNIERSQADICLHFVEKAAFDKAGLQLNRNFIPAGGSLYAGTQIYYIKNFSKLQPYAARLMQLHKWRNKPAELFAAMGCRETTPSAVEAALAGLLNCRVKLCISPQPELALDVDTPADLQLATQLLPSPWRHNYRKVKLIYNPEAGQGKMLSPLFQELLGIRQKKFEICDTNEDYIKRILEYLALYGITAEAVATRAPGHATDLARQCVAGQYDLVIAAGGDGTINEIVNGLANSGVTLGVIPLGTVNVLGLQMKLPREIKAACQVIAAGEKTNIDLGRIGERYFACMAGIGFDAWVVRKLDSRLKRAFGALAFVMTAMIHFLGYRFRRIILKIDDQPILRRGYFVIIGNSKYYGGEMIVATHADISDGYLDVCIFKHKNLLRLLVYFFSMRKGRIDRDLTVEYFQCKRIRVMKKGRHAVHVDAEYLCHTPVEVVICPAAITIAV